MRTLLRTALRPMTADDITQVADVERESFPSMWPQTAYRRELSNKLARYLVLTELRDTPLEPPATSGLWGALRRIVGGDASPGSHEYLLGFIGLWLMVGEAHIVTVAVRERYRRMGVGERLVIAALELAMDAGQEVATLEVRASNETAQRLYEKYGFARLGLRKRYYTDNNEDAVIMTTPDLFAEEFRTRFSELRALHRAEYPDLWA
ncbi:MAG: ribosomal protein S18-alanine N-acetyltransferase [Chloroflexota bacterium]